MSSLATNYLTPTGREEAWRFTPLKRLGGLQDLTQVVAPHLSLELVGGSRSGVSIKKKDAAEVPPISQSDDLIVLRVRDCVREVTTVVIDTEAIISQPIVLHRNSSSSPEFSRTVIKAGAHSRATVIIENTGSTTLGEEIEIILEAGANLTFITSQEWDPATIHLGRHHAIVGRDASFKSITVTVGGSVVRLLPTVEYSAPGGSVELFGVYFATDGQHLEHRIHIDHNVVNAKSRVNYKGALAGNQARTVWIGDVFIRAIAEGTDTYELNRNLLLTDGARADSVPNLEIETGEIVGAGHASTTGRFDDEQLFYLMSRGISSEDARRLVIRGFFAEIITKIGDEVIQERLMSRIDRDLLRVGA